MKRVLICLVLVLGLTAPAIGADLYRVTLHSTDDAALLRRTAVEPVLRSGNEYLVLIHTPRAEELTGLDHELLGVDLSAGRLALDRRFDRANVGRYALLYEKGNLRLFEVEPAQLKSGTDVPDLLPIRNRHIRIKYVEPVATPPTQMAPTIGLDSLIGLVEADSVASYMYRLEAFYRRVTGTDSLRAARDWIYAKYEDFGYDSVYVDSFIGEAYGAHADAYNVVAVKPGTVYPDIQIVVGGHYDGVPEAPAADDNGSGTVGVLEIARVLKDVPTAVSLVFIAFDDEEWGLYGSWHHANNAVINGDQIVFMLNLDMIGDIMNSAHAWIYHGANTQFAQLWADVADSLVGITGSLAGELAGSDHYPFEQNGYEAIFVQEYIFSSHYHSASDSTTYISFDYLNRMIQASLATVYAISELDDFDGDGIANTTDNCMTVANADQTDGDGDLFGDACDNCPGTINPGQQNADGDSLGDLCDACLNDPENDVDGDGICGDEDNCPYTYNPGQEDLDFDGVGDACKYVEPLYVFTGQDEGDSLGWSVCAAGDVNNDGYDDIMMGAQRAGPQDAGEAYVYSGADGSPLYTFTAEGMDDFFGWSMVIADLNSDEYDDMIVGASGYDIPGDGAGRAYVFYGGPGPFPMTVGAADADHILLSPGAGASFGVAVSAIGDVDDDDVTDLAIGACHAKTDGQGEVFVYSGASLSLLYHIPSVPGRGRFGWRVSEIGDVDGDSLPDFVVGAPWDSTSNPNAGAAYVFSGPDGALIHSVLATTRNGYMGWSVAGLGDLNGDGYPEFAAGAPFTGGRSGSVPILSGIDAAQLFKHTGDSAYLGLGSSICNVGDVDGDGISDYAMGAWHWAFQLTTPGEVRLYSGATHTLLDVYYGEGESSQFGSDLCGHGDVNSDGIHDLVVGSMTYQAGGNDMGRAYVYLLGDHDHDGHMWPNDNCPTVPNSGQEDYDGDGNGAACDNCPTLITPDDIHLYTGDANEDSAITASDIIYMVNYTFKSGPAPLPMAEVGDVNCDWSLTAADIIYLVNYTFKSGPEPCDVCAPPVPAFARYSARTIQSDEDVVRLQSSESPDGLRTVAVHAVHRDGLAALDIPLRFGRTDDPIELVRVDFAERVEDWDFTHAQIDNQNKTVILGLIPELLGTHPNGVSETPVSGNTRIADLVFRAEEDYTVAFESFVTQRPTHTLTFIYNRQNGSQMTVEAVTPKFETDASLKSSVLPTEYALSPNFPNPFNPATSFTLSLPEASDYAIRIYNVTGQLVKTYDGHLEAGVHTITWDGRNNQGSPVASGVYFYKAEASGFADTRKMLMLK